jgi:hypothetical protein
MQNEQTYLLPETTRICEGLTFFVESSKQHNLVAMLHLYIELTEHNRVHLALDGVLAVR